MQIHILDLFFWVQRVENSKINNKGWGDGCAFHLLWVGVGCETLPSATQIAASLSFMEGAGLLLKLEKGELSFSSACDWKSFTLKLPSPCKRDFTSTSVEEPAQLQAGSQDWAKARPVLASLLSTQLAFHSCVFVSKKWRDLQTLTLTSVFCSCGRYCKYLVSFKTNTRHRLTVLYLFFSLKALCPAQESRGISCLYMKVKMSTNCCMGPHRLSPRFRGPLVWCVIQKNCDLFLLWKLEELTVLLEDGFEY